MDTNLKKPTKRPKPDKRWTLLFIGNRGRTITLKRFKGMVLATLLILSGLVTISIVLFLWNQNTLHKKSQLEFKLKTLKERIEALYHEKDILMTRLVLAESKVQENLGGTQEKQTEEEKTIDSPNSDSKETIQTPRFSLQLAAKAVEVPIESPPVELKQDSDQIQSELSVAIENFQINKKAENNNLKVQFKIKNTSSDSQRVSGHAIVVLKGDQIQKNQWIPIPRVVLSEGKPTGRQQGYRFGINYFKTMRFTADYPKLPEQYQSAIVYIFAHSGKLLLEQEFPIKLPAINQTERTASTPPSPDKFLKALRNTTQ